MFPIKSTYRHNGFLQCCLYFVYTCVSLYFIEKLYTIYGMCNERKETYFFVDDVIVQFMSLMSFFCKQDARLGVTVLVLATMMNLLLFTTPFLVGAVDKINSYVCLTEFLLYVCDVCLPCVDCWIPIIVTFIYYVCLGCLTNLVKMFDK